MHGCRRDEAGPELVEGCRCDAWGDFVWGIKWGSSKT